MAVLGDLITLYILILLARMILSWVNPAASSGFLGELNHILVVLTEPLLSPIRRLTGVHRVGSVSIDWSLTILLFLLIIIRANL